MRSPAWWACLGVLLLNDHVLKGSGVLPGWVTGKLSDFAGLVVAPVLLSALFCGGLRTPRWVCFALVVVPFVGLKLSDDVAHAVAMAAGWIGLSWRVWVDPTDLVALVVLPFAWRISTPSPDTSRSQSGELGVRERLGVVLGAVACLATSSTPPQEYETRIFLLNITHRAPEMKIFRTVAPINCGLAPEASIAAATFTLDRCVAAEPFRVLPLDQDFRSVDEGRSGDALPEGAPRECDAIVLRAAGLVDTVVYWQDGARKSRAPEIGDDPSLQSDARAVILEAVGLRWVLTPGRSAESWEFEASLVDPSTAGVSCIR